MGAMTTPICDFGWQAVDFDLPATDGKRYSLETVRGPKGTLVMFICNHCPFVVASIERLVRTVAELAAEGIGAVAIMPNDTKAYPADSFEKMKDFAATHGFGFPYVIDEKQAVAKAYDAACTPDFFGFNADLKLQYRGRLDEARMDPVPNARRELLEAMVMIGQTGRGPAAQLPSMGCSIKWRKAA